MKIAQETIEFDGKTVSIFGCCKGAGMIGPQLVPHATMLVYLFTDLAACSEHLQAMLKDAVEDSFNCISVDGDMSTNDTVLLLASGKSGVEAAGRMCRRLRRRCSGYATRWRTRSSTTARV